MSLPVPTEVKRLMGNPSHRPLPESGILLPRVEEIPTPTTNYGAAGINTWRRIWTYCTGWVSTIDYELVDRYCRAADELERMIEKRESDGFFLYDEDGKARPHPLTKAIRELETSMRKDAAELYFSPASRSRGSAIEVAKAATIQKMEEKKAAPMKKGDAI